MCIGATKPSSSSRIGELERAPEKNNDPKEHVSSTRTADMEHVSSTMPADGLTADTSELCCPAQPPVCPTTTTTSQQLTGDEEEKRPSENGRISVGFRRLGRESYGSTNLRNDRPPSFGVSGGNGPEGSPAITPGTPEAYRQTQQKIVAAQSFWREKDNLRNVGVQKLDERSKRYAGEHLSAAGGRDHEVLVLAAGRQESPHGVDEKSSGAALLQGAPAPAGAEAGYPDSSRFSPNESAGFPSSFCPVPQSGLARQLSMDDSTSSLRKTGEDEDPGCNGAGAPHTRIATLLALVGRSSRRISGAKGLSSASETKGGIMIEGVLEQEEEEEASPAPTPNIVRRLFGVSPPVTGDRPPKAGDVELPPQKGCSEEVKDFIEKALLSDVAEEEQSDCLIVPPTPADCTSTLRDSAPARGPADGGVLPPPAIESPASNRRLTGGFQRRSTEQVVRNPPPTSTRGCGYAGDHEEQLPKTSGGDGNSENKQKFWKQRRAKFPSKKKPSVTALKTPAVLQTTKILTKKEFSGALCAGRGGAPRSQEQPALSEENSLHEDHVSAALIDAEDVSALISDYYDTAYSGYDTGDHGSVDHAGERRGSPCGARWSSSAGTKSRARSASSEDTGGVRDEGSIGDSSIGREVSEDHEDESESDIKGTSTSLRAAPREPVRVRKLSRRSPPSSSGLSSSSVGGGAGASKAAWCMRLQRMHARRMIPCSRLPRNRLPTICSSSDAGGSSDRSSLFRKTENRLSVARPTRQHSDNELRARLGVSNIRKSKGAELNSVHSSASRWSSKASVRTSNREKVFSGRVYRRAVVCWILASGLVLGLVIGIIIVLVQKGNAESSGGRGGVIPATTSRPDSEEEELKRITPFRNFKRHIEKHMMLVENPQAGPLVKTPGGMLKPPQEIVERAKDLARQMELDPRLGGHQIVSETLAEEEPVEGGSPPKYWVSIYRNVEVWSTENEWDAKSAAMLELSASSLDPRTYDSYTTWYQEDSPDGKNYPRPRSGGFIINTRTTTSDGPPSLPALGGGSKKFCGGDGSSITNGDRTTSPANNHQVQAASSSDERFRRAPVAGIMPFRYDADSGKLMFAFLKAKATHSPGLIQGKFTQADFNDWQGADIVFDEAVSVLSNEHIIRRVAVRELFEEAGLVRREGDDADPDFKLVGDIIDTEDEERYCSYRRVCNHGRAVRAFFFTLLSYGVGGRDVHRTFCKTSAEKTLFRPRHPDLHNKDHAKPPFVKKRAFFYLAEVSDRWKENWTNSDLVRRHLGVTGKTDLQDWMHKKALTDNKKLSPKERDAFRDGNGAIAAL